MTAAAVRISSALSGSSGWLTVTAGAVMAMVGYAGGREANLNLTDVIWKAAKLRGFTLRAFAHETIGGALMRLTEYLAQGALQPTIAKVFPLSQRDS